MLLSERTEKIDGLKATYSALSKRLPEIQRTDEGKPGASTGTNTIPDSKATIAFSLLENLLDECIFDVLLGVHKDLRTRSSICQICQTKCQGYVNKAGCDIFGNSYTSANLPSYECVNCHKMYPATRYAPHLEKCLGLAGRQSSRVASRRMGSQSPYMTVNMSEDSMGGSDIEPNSFEKKRRRALGKISNDLTRLKKIRAHGKKFSVMPNMLLYIYSVRIYRYLIATRPKVADHIRAELEDSDASDSNYKSGGRRSASPGSYIGDIKRSSSVPVKGVPRSPNRDDYLSRSDLKRMAMKAGRSKSKLAMYSSDEDDFGTKTDLIGACPRVTMWSELGDVVLNCPYTDIDGLETRRKQ
ncbi:hypothetical protein Unana1_01041 [Umbelopsis nana]